MAFVTLKCAVKHQNSGTFLSIDGEGMKSYSAPGAGKVSLSKQIGDNETLYLEKWGENTWSIRAPNHPGVYMRMDGTGVKDLPKGGAGGGKVNCQYMTGIHPQTTSWLLFKLITQPDGSNALESINIPGTFLRGDGSQVNVQNVAGPWCLWQILVLN